MNCQRHAKEIKIQNVYLAIKNELSVANRLCLSMHNDLAWHLRRATSNFANFALTLEDTADSIDTWNN